MSFTAGQILRASQLGPVPCTSTTRPSAPHEGQLIAESDTGMIAIWRTAAWRYVASTGEVSTAAEYNQAANQPLTASTNTTVTFGTANYTAAIVTKGLSATTPGDAFTLNRAGLWSISTTMRLTAPATGEGLFCAIRSNAVNIASANSPRTAGITAVRSFNSGDVIDVLVFTTTASLSTEANNGSGWGRINLSWMRP